MIGLLPSPFQLKAAVAIGIALVLLVSLMVPMAPAIAAPFCRTIEGHEICIIKIKRSAKKYWEYRAWVRVDGVERSREIYNCNSRNRLRQDGILIPFEPNGPGELICKLFKH